MLTLCREVMCESTDILFTNADEARALAGLAASTSPALAARQLSRFCTLVSVTNGCNGAYLALQGEVVYVPPHPCQPVDTCGAGDAYAAGILYGLLRGVRDLRISGAVASRVAATVVAQHGTRLREEDAETVVEATGLSAAPCAEGSLIRQIMQKTQWETSAV